MKDKYTENLERDQVIRNIQLLLSYCMIQIIRQNQVECIPRAQLLNMIWDYTIELQLIHDIKISESQEQFYNLAKEIQIFFENQYKDEIINLRETLSKKQREIENLLLKVSFAEESMKDTFLINKV